MTDREHHRGGWVHYGPPPTRAERDARRETFRRAWEIEDARTAAEHRASFGEPENHTVDSVILPVSGTTLEWRSDGYYRMTLRDDQMPEDLRTWHPCQLNLCTRAGEATPGDRDTPTWWVYAGTARPEQSVQLVLSDGTQVPIVRLGWLWAGEVVSLPRAAHLTIDDSSQQIPMRRPAYLPPAHHPFPP